MNLALRTRIDRAFQIDDASRVAVYAQIYEAANLTSFIYWLQILLSAGIATLGLIESSPAGIIGAMLISPLMGPIMSLGLSLAAGDLILGVKSVLNLSLSLSISVAFAAGLVWLMPFHAATPEILARIHPNLLDLGIAIFSGLAGSAVLCPVGKASGLTALPGVAIAVALMPPLCVVGFGMGSSFDRQIMLGAALLFVTNLVAIVSSAFVVFLLFRMEAPADRSLPVSALRGKPGTVDRFIQTSSILRTLSGFGSLRLRLRGIMLALILGALFVPLRSAFLQVKKEAIARTTVQAAIKRLVSSVPVVAQQVTYSPDGIDISIVSTSPIDPNKLEQARSSIEKRTGEQVTFALQEVASRSDVTDLLNRMSAPKPVVVPKPLTLAQVQTDILARTKTVLANVWPATTPLLGYQMVFSADGPTLQIRYQSKLPLDQFASSLLQQSLQSALQLPTLNVDLEQSPLPGSAKKRAGSSKKKASPRPRTRYTGAAAK
jgi:uncharacterized hydrophobic protein (TIGR00271 family)